MTTIAERLALAQHRITLAAGKCARQATDITLLAVSKTKPVTDIIAAYAAGQRCFGENYVQEGQQKILELRQQYPDIEWHFIGPLQSNKSRAVAELFHWMHTIDRSKIAQRLNEQRPDSLPPLNVCIQINVSGEASKSGISGVQDMLALASDIAQLPRLRLRGLMTIPSAEEGDGLIHEYQQMQQLFAQLQQAFPQVDTLSMGMSHDLELAVAHGATMVRIGSAIFGARDYSQKPA
ncbi:YggS family pyridoxal phosphate-dependent enzyme [Shewanella dokdonensis]|uniref:YggS family pyridoxal phosphate-dependent enzyme n=1 Tax=Shewanella dokdonensis TaxID=712036 RepID=UPI0020109613|nr:YggS family pyridoxal phosphate-dependent enzyme [Shewanella dokdonensis]MCL1074141.1 YggS family pyridoxal phosphate-dependent enzyme [Shewanella dokdonensis]